MYILNHLRFDVYSKPTRKKLYIKRHLVVYSKITLKILYILRHLCVYPNPTIDLYIETRLPNRTLILEKR